MKLKLVPKELEPILEKLPSISPDIVHNEVLRVMQAYAIYNALGVLRTRSVVRNSDLDAIVPAYWRADALELAVNAGLLMAATDHKGRSGWTLPSYNSAA